jgi:holo-[acyl-carrier protein] synthase
VGVDVVDVARIRARLADAPGLAAVLFTPGERAAAAARPDGATFLGQCFAAKEALLKALGRGLVATGPDAALREIEVREDAGGATLSLSGRTAAAVRRHGGVATVALARAGAGGAGVALATVLLLPPAAARRTPA